MVVIGVIGRAETAEDAITVIVAEVIIRAVVRIVAAVVVIVKGVLTINAMCVQS